jgi:hypothetical protein
METYRNKGTTQYGYTLQNSICCKPCRMTVTGKE